MESGTGGGRGERGGRKRGGGMMEEGGGRGRGKRGGNVESGGR